MRLVIYIVFFLWAAPILAQHGNYFLSHYSPDDKQLDNVCFDLVQDQKGIIYLATRTGVLQFDGRSWEVNKDIGAVYTLTLGPEGEIFWGGARGFGIVANEKNRFKNQRLSKTGTKDVFQSVAIKNKIYFLNNGMLFVYSVTSKSTKEIKSTKFTGSFSGLFELFGTVYLNTDQGNIMRVNGEKLSRANLNLNYHEEVVFSERLANDYLLATAGGHLYRCGKNLKVREITLDDKEYAKASVIVGGARINKQLVALGTLRGGVMFINPITGKTAEIINYNAGLPDNEVFALMKDQNKNIWVAHEYGFTRIAPSIPLRSFNYYDGLEGNLLCTISFQNQVYVGTSLGLFKLEEENVYDDISYFVDVEEKKTVKKTKGHTNKSIEEIKSIPGQEVESKKKGFFSFLKRDRSKLDASTKLKNAKQNDNPQYIKEEKVHHILRPSNFVYKKVNGINAKITQLIEVKGRLFAAGLAGVQEVNKLEARPILQEPVRFVYADNEFFHVATYDGKIKSWLLEGNVWKRANILEDIDDDINFIFEGGKNKLWLCSRNQIYSAEIIDKKLKQIQSPGLAVENLDDVVGIHWKGQSIIVNAEGFFGYDVNKNRFAKVDSLPKPTTYFASKNTIWYRTTHGWKSIGVSSDRGNLPLLNLFQELRFITADQRHDTFWLITDKNELFKFFGERLHRYESGYPLLLKSIRNGKGDILYRGEVGVQISIKEQQSALSIEVVKPDYIGSESLEYRYFLKGLPGEWSEWSTSNNKVDFPYLPPGEYVLSVESRDMFGDIKRMEPLDFIVQPPYWQRPLFYALEFILFALLVLLSFKLSARYSIVSRLLSLLTIILLIQLIQTVASSYVSSKTSPVLDFFVQAVVALLVLPVEGYLRRLMLRSYDTSKGIGQLLKIKDNKST